MKGLGGDKAVCCVSTASLLKLLIFPAFFRLNNFLIYVIHFHPINNIGGLMGLFSGNGNGSGSTPPPTLEQVINTTLTAANAATEVLSLANGFANLLGMETKTAFTETLYQQCMDAMAQAGKLATKAYGDQFNGPNDPALGGDTDYGICFNWSTQPNFTNAANSMAQDFSNWGVALTDGDIQNMLETINVEIAAKQGQVGTSFGVVNVGANSFVDWAVAYGTMPQDNEGNQALIYGFAAAQGGGFTK